MLLALFKTIQNTYVIILSNHDENLSNLNQYDFETWPEMNEAQSDENSNELDL